MLIRHGRADFVKLAPVVDHSAEPAAEIDVHKLWRAARRQVGAFAVVVCLAMAAGGGYLKLATPQYSATTQILLDNRALQGMNGTNVAQAPAADATFVESQLEVLRSDTIASKVVATLELDRDRAIVDGAPGLTAVGRSWLRETLLRASGYELPQDRQTVPTDPRRTALDWLLGRLEVARVGRTHVLSISFTDFDQARSARVANAVAEAYLTHQLESKFEATKRASAWLQDRVIELQESARTADFAIQRYRAENDLFAAGGQLVSEQQLAELASQLVVARAETARVQAQYDRVSTLVREGRTEALVGAALDQPTYNELRTSYLDAARRREAIVEALGADHVQVSNLDEVLKQFRQLMLDELRIISEGYLSELEIARGRETTLANDLRAALTHAATTNEAQVVLRELEAQAESYSLMLATVQQQLQEAIQRQSFPIPDAHIITVAKQPERPQEPRASLVLAASFLLGAMLGAGIGVLREISDRVFRTGAQIRDELDLEFLGMLPTSTIKRKRRRARQNGPGSKEFVASGPLRNVLELPLSPYAESLRAIKLAADVTLGDKRSKVIGIVSTLPGEGKTMTAKNLASLIAMQGSTALLIDCDMRNPELSSELLNGVDNGLLDVLLGGARLSEVVHKETETGLHFLPATARRVSHTADLIASPAMQALLGEARESYDYVIVDCPPLAPVIDARAAARVFDAFVLVVGWSRTPRHAVRTDLQTESAIRERCIGVVLNNVCLRKLRKYEGRNSENAYLYSSKAYFSTQSRGEPPTRTRGRAVEDADERRNGGEEDDRGETTKRGAFNEDERQRQKQRATKVDDQATVDERPKRRHTTTGNTQETKERHQNEDDDGRQRPQNETNLDRGEVNT